MRAFIASDDSSLSYQLRDTLRQLGHECPASLVASLDAAHSRVGAFTDSGRGEEPPQIVLMVLPPDVEHALEILRDIHRKTPIRIFAVGPTGDSKLVLRTLREGAHEYLDQSDVPGELAAALERLVEDEGARPARGRIIAVMPASGGCGASTLAANFAVVLAKATNDCLLFDLNREAGDLAPLLDLKPSYTLADLCRSATTRLDRSLLEGALAVHSSGVRLLAAPARVTDADYVTVDGVRKVLSLAVDIASFILVDLPHNYRPETMQALGQADEVLLVTRLDFTSLRNARRLVDHLQDAGPIRERLQIVVNRYRQPGELSVADATAALGMKISHFIIDDPKAINRANNNGIPVVLHSPSAKVSAQITDLAAKLREDRLRETR